MMAMAADYVVFEVNEIVEPGQLNLDDISTPGIFVDAVVQGRTYAEIEKYMEENWKNIGVLR
jgi:acetate CoA/acetoacetate CoA-transferase alpha subunit